MAKLCTQCGNDLVLSNGECEICGHRPPTEKKCPHCAETVLDEATMCKHCKTNLVVGSALPSSAPRFEARTQGDASAPAIMCDKCHRTVMAPDRVYRLSGCLVAIGYFLVVPGLLMMLGGIGFTFLGAGLGAAATGQTFGDIKKATVRQLEKSNVSQAIIDEYARTNTVSDRSIASLNPGDQVKVRRSLQMDAAGKAGAALGGATAPICGGALTMATFLAGLPTFIIGFLLILKKSVWRCPTCGYIFERA